jgi:4-nitrophenyl phosphatase
LEARRILLTLPPTHNVEDGGLLAVACRALQGYDAVLMDLDGVLWVEGRPIEANVSVARELAEEGRLVVVTNNSTRSRLTYSRLLREKLGIEVPPERVVTSGYSASRLLLRVAGKARVYVVGEEGLVQELEAAGHEVLTVSEAAGAEAVVVGLDRTLSYVKLEAALKALLRGAIFVATNLDHALPGREGLRPGAGAIVAALETASRRRVDYVAGKPEKWMLDAALEAAGSPRNPVVVGDRVDTDIAMALRWGLPAVLVETGVGSASELGEGHGDVVVAGSLEELCREG